MNDAVNFLFKIVQVWYGDVLTLDFYGTRLVLITKSLKHFQQQTNLITKSCVGRKRQKRGRWPPPPTLLEEEYS